ncbi:MAG TPA: OmpA family protein [Burkholderiales bacterium]
MKTPYQLTLLAAVLAGGCAISQPAQERLDAARATYRSAAADPAVQRYAQPELQGAANALNDAERIAAEGRYSELVEHNAYLAERARQALAASELAAEVKGLESADIRARETQRGWVLTLNNDRMFEQGITLAPSAGATLERLAQFLRKHPEHSVAIEGFTDSEGPASANERLSERRAQAVKFALVQKGIEPSRIDARGYGASFPVASNETEGGRSLNRRVEIVLSPS